MLAYLFELPEHRVRVIAPPDVGGGLGPKGELLPGGGAGLLAGPPRCAGR